MQRYENLGEVSDKERYLNYTHSTGYYHDATISPKVAERYNRIIRANNLQHVYDQKALNKRVTIIKKTIIRQIFRQTMPVKERLRLIFGYLQFWDAVRMILGIFRRKIVTLHD